MLLEAHARTSVLAMLPKGKIGAEIGVYRGAFSQSILLIARPKTLHLIDPWKAVDAGPHKGGLYGTSNVTQGDMDTIHDAVVQQYKPQITLGSVKVHRGASQDVLGAMEDASLDYVYIDGDHSYEGVLQDLRMSFKKVKPGGMIAGDDYVVGNWWQDGVVRAVHDFLHEVGAAVVIRLALDTQFLLQVRATRSQPKPAG